MNNETETNDSSKLLETNVECRLKDLCSSYYEKFSAGSMKLARDILQIAQMSVTNRYVRVFNHLNYSTYKKYFAELAEIFTLNIETPNLKSTNDMLREAFLKKFVETFLKNLIE